MPYMLASQMDSVPPPPQGGGLVDYLRRFMQPRSVLDVIDRYQYGPQAPTGPVRPYVTQNQATPLARVAADPAAAPGRSAEYVPMPRGDYGSPDVEPRSAPAPADNPAVTAIRQGATAAREAAGPEPVALEDDANEFELGANLDPSLLETGKTIAAASEQPSFLDQMLQQIKDRSHVSDSDKWLAVARGGFGAAASRNPTFLGAASEGAMGGIDAFQRSQNRATEAAVRAAQLSLTERARAEQERHNKATETDRAERTKIARQQSDDLQKYREAIAGQGRYSVAGQTPDGFPVLFDSKTGDEKVLGTKVSVLKGASGKGTGGGLMGHIRTMFPNLSPEQQMAKYNELRAMTPDRRRAAALRLGASMGYSPQQQRELADEFDAELAGAASPAPAASAGAPSAPAGGMSSPRTPAEYEALPPGTKYRHPDGSIRTKGG